MVTSIEQLPVEIWLEIFSYLEVRDLFDAFKNVNTYFNQLLACTHLRFSLIVKKYANNHLNEPDKSYWSDSILNRITYIQSATVFNFIFLGEFLQWNFNELIRLQSLIIEFDIFQTDIVCELLPKIHLLKYLSMTCIMTSTLFECILALPTLRLCRFDIINTAYCEDFHSEKTSNIEVFILSLRQVIEHSFINRMLSYMPNLKRLEISGPVYPLYKPLGVSVHPYCIQSNLQIIKYKFEHCYYETWYNINSFEPFGKCQHLNMLMPNLKYFNMNIREMDVNRYILDKMDNPWWINLRTIEKVKITVHGLLDKRLFNSETLDHYQKKFLSKHEKLNKFFKYEWITSNLEKSERIPLTIQVTKINQ